MALWIGIVLGAALLAGWLCLSGAWRKAFVPFTISPRRMTVSRLGLCVQRTEDIDRVNSILAAFARGFNAMITRVSVADVDRFCDAQPALLQPFSEEGKAMGYVLRSLFRYDARRFEHDIVKPRPEFRYLYYVGLGFWSGMRNHGVRRLAQIVEGLDPLHAFLCYDGYGFKYAFFDDPTNPGVLQTRLADLPDYARNAAFHGVGRALWFRFMDRFDLLIARLRLLGEHAPDAAAGVGLAMVFVNPDRFEKALDQAALLPPEWQAHAHLGMCFALKARSINNVDQFARDMARYPRPIQDAVYASIRECDRVELLVRADDQDDKYRRWRETVARWMTEHVEYPLAGLKIDARQPLGVSAAAK